MHILTLRIRVLHWTTEFNFKIPIILTIFQDRCRHPGNLCAAADRVSHTGGTLWVDLWWQHQGDGPEKTGQRAQAAGAVSPCPGQGERDAFDHILCQGLRTSCGRVRLYIPVDRHSPGSWETLEHLCRPRALPDGVGRNQWCKPTAYLQDTRQVILNAQYLHRGNVVDPDPELFIRIRNLLTGLWSGKTYSYLYIKNPTFLPIL